MAQWITSSKYVVVTTEKHHYQLQNITQLEIVTITSRRH